MNFLKKILLYFVTLQLLVAAPIAFSAEGEDDPLAGTFKDFSTVVAMGVGGAVLGLSTLSFVEEPKDNLKNILVGLSLGVILGVGYIAWTQANKTQSMYEEGSSALNDRKSFATETRLSWHRKSFGKTISHSSHSSLSQVSYSFSF